ncbi:hypothetical protein TNCV_2303511 [Trichonephila clavipes]|nr:hypothetical protein TNCV_2303511 [Trichonephila clavipes]
MTDDNVRVKLVGEYFEDQEVLETTTRLTVLDKDAPARRTPTTMPLFTLERSDIIKLWYELNFLMLPSYSQMLDWYFPFFCHYVTHCCDTSGKWHVIYGVPVPERDVPPHQNFSIKSRINDFT